MGFDSYLVRVDASAAADFVADPGDRLIEELVDDWGPPQVIDLERSLNGLHYLLNGTIQATPGPLGMAFQIREGFNPDDEFPTQYLPPGQVHEIAKALAAVTKDHLLSNFDLDKISEASFMYREALLDEDPGLPNLWRLFEWARELYGEANSRGEAVFIIES